MALITARLTLRPLDAEELGWYADEPALLEKRIGAHAGEPLPAFFRAIVLKQREKVFTDPQNRFWLTFWLLIDDLRRLAVGSIDFKNVPDDRKQVEIGYGIDVNERKKGYATEAVVALCFYAFQTGRVERVVAETEAGNVASEKVLKKAGFSRYEKKGGSTWWELRKS